MKRSPLYLAIAMVTATTPAGSQDVALETFSNGFRIDGIAANDLSGRSVSGAGDVNGDGLADLIVGAPGVDQGNQTSAGESYVVFGKRDSSLVNLATLETSGSGGFRIAGIDANDRSGISVSGAGDVNGDGLTDLIIGVDSGDPSGLGEAGESYVVFGKPDTSLVDLDNLGQGGFRIDGAAADDRSGNSVAGAGDVNGDGLADLIVGAFAADPGANSSAGESYVVFGKADSDVVSLATLDGGGFVISGSMSNDLSGRSVSGAGDINGDGLADLIVGAYGSDPGGASYAGETFVLFGKSDTAPIDLGALNAEGFRIVGVSVNDFSGISVSGAGDVNGDGLADVVVGAYGADPGGDGYAGATYVVFGKSDNVAVDLAVLGTGGFRIDGIDVNDYSGRSVAGAGDVNGDGLADVVVGAYRADAGGVDDAGESYIVFGKADSAPVDLESLGNGGFRIDGFKVDHLVGGSVSGAGDVNGDGSADLIIGSDGDPGGINGAGQTYVIFSPTIAPSTATYRARARDGDAPRVAVGVTGDGSNDSTPDSRFWIDYAEGVGPSNETVLLRRSEPEMAGPATAAVSWEIASDRIGSFQPMDLTFKYLDREVASLVEASLTLRRADTISGPFVDVAATIDRQKNLIHLSTTELGVFAISGTIGQSFPTPMSAGNRQGTGIAGSGNRFAVGSPGMSSGAGQVTIYRVEGLELVPEQVIDVPSGFIASQFGAAVAMTDDRLLIGAPGISVPAKSGKGLNALQAALYQLVNQQWQFKQPLPSANPGSDDGFGSALAIHGTQIIVGAPGDDTMGTDAGAAYLFAVNEDGSSLLETTTVMPPMGSGNSQFGFSVAASSNGKFAAGAPGGVVGAVVTGSVSLLDAVGNNLSTLAGSQSANGDGFGTAVNMTGDQLIVGAPGEDGSGSDTGAAYLFDTGGSSLVQTGQITADVPIAGSGFGQAVTIAQGGFAVGSPLFGDGAVYQYDASLNQVMIFQASPGQTGFGTTLAGDAVNLLIGAPSSDANGGAAVLQRSQDLVFMSGFESD